MTTQYDDNVNRCDLQRTWILTLFIMLRATKIATPKFHVQE